MRLISFEFVIPNLPYAFSQELLNEWFTHVNEYIRFCFLKII